MPRAPGERVKTNRRDADQLARLHRAGELTPIHVPEPEDEAVRDLLRARWQTAQHQHRARQQLKSFLLRHNFRYAGTKPWTPAHLRYLATIKLPFPEQPFVFQEMVNLISEAGARLERYDAQLPRVVAGWRFEPVVQALMGLRGLALLNAATLAAELGDLHRFATARQLMSYLGLVPSEDSTGDSRHQGGLTKMGNGFARRALIEAAWNYRLPARISCPLLARQEGLSQAVKDASWNAQTRLHHRYKHLTAVARKKSPVAAAALGRELSGFVWAVGRLAATLTVVALALLAGKGDLAAIQRFGTRLSQPQRQTLDFWPRKGTKFYPAPTYTVLRALLMALDVDAFADVLTRWLQSQAARLPASLALDKLSRPVKDAAARSWRGINLFLSADLQAILAVLGGKHQISGLTSRRLQKLLP